jgi:hypothetical protein
VREVKDCSSTIDYIRLMKEGRAFKRPVKSLMQSVIRMAQRAEPSLAKDRVIRAAQDVIGSLQDLAKVLVPPELDTDTLDRIEQVKDRVEADPAKLSTALEALDRDLDLVVRAYGVAVVMADEENEQVEYQIEEASVKDILDTSISEVSAIRQKLEIIDGSLRALAERQNLTVVDGDLMRLSNRL